MSFAIGVGPTNPVIDCSRFDRLEVPMKLDVLGILGVSPIPCPSTIVLDQYAADESLQTRSTLGKLSKGGRGEPRGREGLMV